MHKHKKTDSLKIGKFVPLSSSTTNSDHSSGQNQKALFMDSKIVTGIQKSQTTFNNVVKCLQKRSAIQNGMIYSVPKNFTKAQSQYAQSDKLSINIIQSHQNASSFPFCVKQQCEMPDIDFLNYEQALDASQIKKGLNKNINILSNQQTQRIQARFVRNPFALHKESDKNSYSSQEVQSNLSSSYFRQKTDRGDKAKVLESEIFEARQQIERLFQIIDNQSNAIGILRQKLDKFQKKQVKMSHQLEIQTLKNKKLRLLLQQAEKQSQIIFQHKQKTKKSINLQNPKKDFSMLNNKLQNWQLMLYLIICLVISKLF